ncbi:SurA N-terminal domain-containing protein [Sphingomonas sp. BK235]|jgi:peptidyl-prolyl cis-trans isomerase C|uniref:SurA N-terminal domain-containing protein n=1 Tax=Sphingomonas sp. BK235 TaxID=2512131 RepID=UPI001047461A|nr:SurA N-terminal domain-containing protein [Sphingomonas sp. BK235]TCP33065.1 EpsD family peptidyl-prolyl cis-trans isomerase [Sphingomonas sp. BK235]
MFRRGTLVAVSSLALLAAGCDRKPTGQTVAVVNGDEISVGELNAELQQANVPQGADQKQVRTQLLQNIISRRLLAQDARKNGVDKTPEFLSRQRRLTDELLIAMNAERQAGSQKLPDQKAIDDFMAANPQAFAQRQVLALQQIVIDPPQDPKVLEPLKDAHTMDAVAAMLTKLNIPFTRTTGRLDTASVPPEVLKRIFALPASEPFVLPANGKLFASVIVGREPVAASADDMRKAAVAALRKQNEDKSLNDQVKQLRTSAKIEYQPGYAPPAGTGGAAAPGAAKK